MGLFNKVALCASTALTLFLAFLLYHAWNANRTPGLVLPPPYVAQVGAGIVYDGFVVPAGVDKLKEVYERRDPFPAQTFIMHSPGGEGPTATVIAKFINDNGLVFVAMDGSKCESACTLIYMDTNKHFAQDRAIFMFHAARYFKNDSDKLLEKFGLKREPPEPVENLMRDRLRQTWPKLADFFAGCEKDPTTTVEGMYLTGKELNAILDGTFTETCKQLPPHDSVWADEHIKELGLIAFPG